MTLQPANPLDKPVLDHQAFQQLLSAAYTLQGQSDHLLVKKAQADSRQTLSGGAVAEKVYLISPVSLTPVPLGGTELLLKPVVPMAQSDAEPSAALNDSLLQPVPNHGASILVPEVPEAARFEAPQSKSGQLILLVRDTIPSASSGSRSEGCGGDSLRATNCSGESRRWWRWQRFRLFCWARPLIASHLYPPGWRCPPKWFSSKYHSAEQNP